MMHELLSSLPLSSPAFPSLPLTFSILLFPPLPLFLLSLSLPWQDISGGASSVLCVLSVRDTVWVGFEHGYIMVYSAWSKQPSLQLWPHGACCGGGKDWFSVLKHVRICLYMNMYMNLILEFLSIVSSSSLPFHHLSFQGAANLFSVWLTFQACRRCTLGFKMVLFGQYLRMLLLWKLWEW